MHDIFEIIVELIIEGVVELIEIPKIPTIIRLLLITIIFGSIISLCVVGGSVAIKKIGIIGAIICWIIAVGLIFLWLYICYRIIKSSRNKHSK